MTDEALSMRTWLGKILLVLTGVIFALGLCEVGLRLAGIEYPHFYTFDPETSAKLRPGIKGYWLKEGGGYVSINSDGWRDREHAFKKPPNTLRIAVLGDSYTEAMQVNEDETFSAILEKELQRCGNLQGRKVEVLNFGISGFGTTQELLTLRHRVWKYSPDVVLLAFTTGNDVSDNSRKLKKIDYNPYYVYKGNKLVLDDQQTSENWEAKQHSLWKKMDLDAFLHLRFFQVMNHAKDLFWKWWLPEDTGQGPYESLEGHEAGMSDLTYQEPTTEDWKEAWRVTEGVLLEMRDEVIHGGAQFFVVALSNSIQVNPKPAKRQAYAKALGVPDLFYTDHRLEGFCQSRHIPILLLAPYFQEYATQHQVYLHGFGKTLSKGHWNQQGHRLAGQTIAKWLCPQVK